MLRTQRTELGAKGVTPDSKKPLLQYEFGAYLRMALAISMFFISPRYLGLTPALSMSFSILSRITVSLASASTYSCRRRRPKSDSSLVALRRAASTATSGQEQWR